MNIYAGIVIFIFAASAKPAKDMKEERFPGSRERFLYNPEFSFSRRISNPIFFLYNLRRPNLNDNRYFHEVQLGESVSLNCPDKNNLCADELSGEKRSYYYQKKRNWIREPQDRFKEFLFLGTEKITADPRLAIEKDGNLTIHNINPGDYGWYFCVRETIQSLIIRDTIVHGIFGNIPPKVSAVKSMIVAPEHDEVTLKCEATGNPQPEIIWKRNDEGKEVFDGCYNIKKSTVSSIKIANYSKEPTASYSCMADYDGFYFSNDAILSKYNAKKLKTFATSSEVPTTSLSTSVPTSVTSYNSVNSAKPSPAPNAHPSDADSLFQYSVSGKITVTEDGIVTLECTATGFPQFGILWEKNSEEKCGTHKDNIFDNDEIFSEVKSISILNMSNINEKATGSYECTATNAAGTEKTRISVEVQSSPDSSLGLQP
ncbi:hemicentin-1-like isoform X2 [Artemia franciscana]|uniref:hemicentin-1-like isoform X2 n=1 Tax=Artemia franciscana TaxID=6661 RepID=UPI0032DA3FD5